MKRYAISRHSKYAITDISLRIDKSRSAKVQIAVHSYLMGRMIFGTISRWEAAEILKDARIERLKIKKGECS